VAVKLCVTPRSSETVGGVTLTLMDEGVGVGGGVDGGWTIAENPPAHPQATRTTRREKAEGIRSQIK